MAVKYFVKSGSINPVQGSKASRKFCDHLDMSQIGIVCFTKRCLGVSKFRILKKLSRFYFFQRDLSQRDLQKRL